MDSRVIFPSFHCIKRSQKKFADCYATTPKKCFSLKYLEKAHAIRKAKEHQIRIYNHVVVLYVNRRDMELLSEEKYH
jgi:hypothetical protein